MATIEEIVLPDIGDFANVEVIEILVAPGDQVLAEQSLLTVESDKATIEIPAPRVGVIQEVIVRIGDKVSQGARLMTLAVGEGAPDAAPAVVVDTLPVTPELPPVAPAAEVEIISVILPDIGDLSDLPVVEILVAPGDRITANQSLLTLETDKATMEVPAPQAGIVEEIAVKIGDVLNPGDLLLMLRPVEQSTPAPVAPAKAPENPLLEQPDQQNSTPPARAHGEAERRQAPVLPRPADMTAIATGRKPHASPTVRRFARELGVDLARVKGSGAKGRATKADVQSFVKKTLAQGNAGGAAASLPFAFPAAPEVDYSRFGAIEVVDLSRIKKLSGRHLHRCWLTVPHVTQFDQADITELEAFRKSQPDGVKLTLLAFLLKAVAVALQRMPILKASLSGDGEQLVFKQFTHIGVAVDTPNGLLVPVVRDVDQKNLTALAQELVDLSAKARAGKLAPADLQCGCFSISSLGGIGGTAFTPIVNAPEVAILGVSRSAMQPVWNGAEFVPRLLLPLSLSYDHRVVDGADGARFTTLLAQLLGDIRRLLL
ncbi:dihydrolipoyllysine-residue acetyltransferase [Chromatium okenii]|uniref:Acetyltransferase component of pyruvate dehydrogenase complex n=1 Tax=Chromatium okenii TaxID=61644 RepID=A0A2S7XQP4_9GAMM|nr:dihydrolipoyllysine-residue acetyltransferase [Chromatium okenii]PQJ95752.1 dihydrolipoyllysine-residue acetyltransferase [Chromatium okenii]